ncbi:MAG: T9SS type A sorting domain-containing protein [Ignavibacteriales bacterium]|nr:T9SS type A sorting domain-containing protein [Ignavibacteriales bacterium]
MIWYLQERIVKKLVTVLSALFAVAAFAQNSAPAEPLPSSFDLRDVGGENYVTVPKSQRGGTCWTHGTMSSIESVLLKSGVWAEYAAGVEPDFAEYHLDWWNGFNRHWNPDASPTTGDGLELHFGGDYRVATAYLSRLAGAVADEEAQSFDDAPAQFSDDYSIFSPRHVEWFTVGDNLERIDLLKRVIMERGAVGTCMMYAGAFLDGTTHYQPPSDPQDPNHSIAIIGWDDAKKTQAPEDGAWLCKNSWGTDWGEDGFFWISYYDKHAAREPQMGFVSFRDIRRVAGEKAYYHDVHGWRDELTDVDRAFNAFTADGDETLRSVSFFTAADTVDYVVEIFDDFAAGELQHRLAVESGAFEFTGYHTVDLDTAVALAEGDDFYVAVTLSKGGHAYDRTSIVPVLLGSRGTITVTSAANAGESYYHDGAAWADLYDRDLSPHDAHTANFCIKAYATSGVPTLEIGEARVPFGAEEFGVPVYLWDGPALSRLEFSVGYDDAVATFERFDPIDETLAPATTTGEGSVTIVLDGEGLRAPRHGKIGELVFSNPLASSALVLTDVSAADTSDGDATPTTIDGAIALGAGEAPKHVLHVSGDFKMAAHNDASIGGRADAASAGPGVLWNNERGGYTGGVVFGTAAREEARGSMGSFLSHDESLATTLLSLGSDYDDGFSSNDDFNEIAEATVVDYGAGAYPVKIIQRTMTNLGEPYGMIRYGFVNEDEATLDGLSAGMFFDWDLGNYQDDVGGIDVERRAVYESAGDVDLHFGLVALNGLDGARVTSKYSVLGDAQAVRDSVYDWLTTVVLDFDDPGDQRTWIGTALGDVPPGDTAWVAFAVVAGTTLDEMFRHADSAQAKAARLGWSDPPTSKRDDASVERFRLRQNYPNPFNPTTTITFELPRQRRVSLDVFDALGARVATLADGEFEAGVHRVSFDAAELAAGVYFYRIIAGDFVETKKALLLK